MIKFCFNFLFLFFSWLLARVQWIYESLSQLASLSSMDCCQRKRWMLFCFVKYVKTECFLMRKETAVLQKTIESGSPLRSTLESGWDRLNSTHIQRSWCLETWLMTTAPAWLPKEYCTGVRVIPRWSLLPRHKQGLTLGEQTRTDVTYWYYMYFPGTS